MNLRGRLVIEYLKPGNATWPSLIPSIARNIGDPRAWA